METRMVFVYNKHESKRNIAEELATAAVKVTCEKRIMGECKVKLLPTYEPTFQDLKNIMVNANIPGQPIYYSDRIAFIGIIDTLKLRELKKLL